MVDLEDAWIFSPEGNEIFHYRNNAGAITDPNLLNYFIAGITKFSVDMGGTEKDLVKIESANLFLIKKCLLSTKIHYFVGKFPQGKRRGVIRQYESFMQRVSNSLKDLSPEEIQASRIQGILDTHGKKI